MLRIKKKGFTLAEVLVTLGIIGIVAAMTIPTIIGKYQKKVVESRLKEAYALLTEMTRLAEAEYGIFDPSDVLVTTDFSRQNAKNVFNKYFAPYIKITKNYSDTECTKLTESYGVSPASEKYIDYNGACYGLANGTAISFWAGKQTTDYFLYNLQVIINPNKSRKISGKDNFGFSIYYDDNGSRLTTYPRVVNLVELTDEKLGEYCSSNSGRINAGGYSLSRTNFCTELLMRNGFKIPDKYPVKF